MNNVLGHMELHNINTHERYWLHIDTIYYYHIYYPALLYGWVHQRAVIFSYANTIENRNPQRMEPKYNLLLVKKKYFSKTDPFT